MEIKDSGKREEFSTGSRRDTREGKGRFDLLPTRALAAAAFAITNRPDLLSVSSTLGLAVKHAFNQLHSGATIFTQLEFAVSYSLWALELDETPGVCFGAISAEEPRYDMFPARGIFRLARHFENGSKKYGDRNWEKGQEISRMLDSGIRHAFAFFRGDRDEDHLAAAAWNFVCALDTWERIRAGILPSELNDIPA